MIGTNGIEHIWLHLAANVNLQESVKYMQGHLKDLFNLNYFNMGKKAKKDIGIANILLVVISIIVTLLLLCGCKSTMPCTNKESQNSGYALPDIHKKTHEQLLQNQKQLYEINCDIK